MKRFALVAALALAAGTASTQAPPEKPADLGHHAEKLSLEYEGRALLTATVRAETASGKSAAVHVTEGVARGARGQLTQTITLHVRDGGDGCRIHLSGIVRATEEAFPAETRGAAQSRFPCVRNAVGLSRNLRNNAIYDRRRDWVLVGPGNFGTKITPRPADGVGRLFSIDARGPSIQLAFKPRFYQRHKNLPFYQPWKYRVWRGSVTGWCSWWPCRARFTETDLRQLLAVFTDKRLADFGYRYIQIDDTFQSGASTPNTWLEWNDKFPGGMSGYADLTRSAGFEPGIWVAAMFKDAAFARSHPDWFIPDAKGSPMRAPWLGFGVDTTVPAAIDNLVRPTFRGIKARKFSYVKVDSLRHLLYDALYQAREHLQRKGVTVEDAFRRYMQTARAEIGRDTFLLACWGVFPEMIGIADGCRLGTDGFGAAKLQQYNSWNGVVWRNDPDHCDVLPKGGGTPGDAIIRPAIVSMAGAMLMLSDRAEVYEDERNLEGVRRSSPVLFTVPGQLYDYDPVTSDRVTTGIRPTTGAGPGPIDAKHDLKVCPWWLLEVDRPWEHWNVLGRFNFSRRGAQSEERVSFADLGLDPRATYLVYEFWTKQFLGARKDFFMAAAQDPRSLRLYAIRRELHRPQIVSTSRHISQGGVDLVQVRWESGALTGKSRVVQGDHYTLVLTVPPRFSVASARIDDKPAQVAGDNDLLRIGCMPDKTGVVRWAVQFSEKEKR